MDIFMDIHIHGKPGHATQRAAAMEIDP